VVPTEQHHKIWKELERSVDVHELGEDLTQLHQDMKARATLPEHHEAADVVAQAAQAARAGQGPEAVAWLGTSTSNFATTVAKETGKEICADLLKALLMGILL
jgi:acetylornithine deacetylase/succinyl-diaminopimelate desuccinylase-like protein